MSFLEEINQGNSQVSCDVQCSTRAAPLSGETREDQELQQHLADLVCAGHREDTGRVFCTVGTGTATGIAAAGEGRVVARERDGRRDTLPWRAGTGAALPPGFAD